MKTPLHDAKAFLSRSALRNLTRRGGFCFTLRDALAADPKRGAGSHNVEKIRISRRGRLTPMHRHNPKVGNIVNRGVSPAPKPFAVRWCEGDAT